MSDRLIAFSEAEKAMKIQEVILKAMSKEITWGNAAEIIGVSDRTMRRWKKRYQQHGFDGLFDRRKQPSPKRPPLEVVELALSLYRTEYRGFNVKHFHEMLVDHHDFEMSYSWLKNLLQDAGLVERPQRKGTYRRRRERKPLCGQMLHLDGSTHRWSPHPHDEMQDLLVLLDDATSELVVALFVPQESTRSCLQVLERAVCERGTFARLYTDRASHFVFTPTAGGKPDRSKPTQLEQVLDELGVELVVAYSPQARGRSERMFGTLQGRLPAELRRAQVGTYEEANAYLEGVYLPKHNEQFTVEASQKDMSAWLPTQGVDLEEVFSLRCERTVRRDHTIQYDSRVLQLDKPTGHSVLSGRKVKVRELLTGEVRVRLGNRLVGQFPAEQSEPPSETDVAV